MSFLERTKAVMNNHMKILKEGGEKERYDCKCLLLLT